eukprot:216724-Chlamydomonas_euryale.AAC.3
MDGGQRPVRRPHLQVTTANSQLPYGSSRTQLKGKADGEGAGRVSTLDATKYHTRSRLLGTVRATRQPRGSQRVRAVSAECVPLMNVPTGIIGKGPGRSRR